MSGVNGDRFHGRREKNRTDVASVQKPLPLRVSLRYVSAKNWRSLLQLHLIPEPYTKILVSTDNPSVKWEHC
jgi:hypothetical protein